MTKRFAKTFKKITMTTNPSNDHNPYAGPQTDGEMSFLSHALELRTRLIYCVLFFALCASVAYAYAEHIFNYLLSPLPPEASHRLIYTGLPEAFLTYVKLALWTGLFVSLPFMIHQVWRFIAPGLYKEERKSVFFFMLLTPLLFFTGAAFSFYAVIPNAWKFFLSFEQRQIDMVPIVLEARISEYLSITLQLVFAFGCAFLLPVALFVCHKIGVLSVTQLTQGRRYAFILILIVSAILTPPDVFSMIALSIPLYFLYEMSIILIKSFTQK